MNDQDINNIHAWRMLQKGKARPDDQKLAYEIFKHLLSKPARKRNSISTWRNLLLDLLIDREGILQQKAYEIVAEIESCSVTSVRKPYEKWKVQTPEGKRFDIERYFKTQCNFTDEAEQREKTKRIQDVVRLRSKD